MFIFTAIAGIIVVAMIAAFSSPANENSNAQKTPEHVPISHNPKNDFEPDTSREIIAEQKKGNLIVEIEYANIEGEITQRIVSITEVARTQNAIYITGNCYLANSERTFRVDRILRAKNAISGRIISDPQRFFNDLFDADRDLNLMPHVRTIRWIKPGLIALIWVMGGKKRLHHELLMAFTNERLKMAIAHDSAWTAAINTQWCAKQTPTRKTVEDLLNPVKSAKERALISKYINDLQEIFSDDQPLQKRGISILTLLD